MKKPTLPPSTRTLKIKVKTAKKRSLSSTLWLQRQLNDPYVAQAKIKGYRSRAAFKLEQLDEKFRFLKSGAHILDLGAAPGGWMQVAAARIHRGTNTGFILGVDLQEIEPLIGASSMVLDFLSDDAEDKVRAALPTGKVDVVLSDMADAATGYPQIDHIRIMALCEAAAMFAMQILNPQGSFICKILQGGAEQSLLSLLKKHFTRVSHFKPQASRADSSELYLIASGFKSPT